MRISRGLRVGALSALLAVPGSWALVSAQGALAVLGLTDATARTFVLDEISSPANDRRAPIVLAGTRAFLKMPAGARGPAATALFGWAKTYVNSPAFRASYDSYRSGVVGTGRRPEPTIEATLQKEADEQRAGLEEMRRNLAASGLPPEEQEKILASWKAAAAQAASPEFADARRKALEAERAEKSASDAGRAADMDVRLPADPQRLFARRLREFLDHTAAVNFAAKRIRLTGGPDGIEFVDKADRKRPWMWQAAAIVGPEATAAARAAAEAWLREIER